MKQLALFKAVEDAFARHGELDTGALYAVVQQAGVVDSAALTRRQPVGRSGQRHSTAARSVRWVQQTLKHRGLIERLPNKRGRWRVTHEGKSKLTRLPRGVALLAFNTRLGLAVWGDCADALKGLDKQCRVQLILTSPPYPIAKGRAYGRIAESEYVDWLCRTLEPLVERLAEGGNLALNISNDIFDSGKPSRSLYRERLVLALHDRLGLVKMDELIWHNPVKAPGPIAWASKKRFQLNATWEPVYWFTNCATKCLADNRRVLQPHTRRQQKLIDQGGTKRTAEYADGTYRLRPGSFANPTSGKIPRNVLTHAHTCKSQRDYKRAARERGFAPHGAPMPLSLARQLIRFLSEPGGLMVDPMAGSLTSGLGAELEGRPWLCSDLFGEYVGGAACRFDDIQWQHPDLLKGPIRSVSNFERGACVGDISMASGRVMESA